MAQRTSHLGWVVAATAVLLFVTGCGGSSSSAPGTGSSTQPSASAAQSSTKTAKTHSQSGDQGAKGEAAAGRQQQTKADVPPSDGEVGAAEGKKNPPLQLPEGKPEEGPTKAQRAKVPKAAMAVSVPAAADPVGAGALPARYTCDGKNEAPEVTWGKLPAGTAEAALFVMNLAPVDGKLYFDYALAGIDPGMEGLKAAEVPDGAVIGRNSAGQQKYSFCPQGSGPETIVFAVYAISKSLSPKAGFEPLAFRKAATPLSPLNGFYTVSYPGE